MEYKMAEKKASSTKRKASTAKRATTAKSTVSKKTAKVVKKPAKKSSKAKAAEVKSFKRCSEQQPFMTLKFTNQTIYWLIICVMAFTLGTWILKVQHDVLDLYDQVDQIRLNEPDMPIKKTTPKQSVETPAE